jgi:hypothetical protein
MYSKNRLYHFVHLRKVLVRCKKFKVSLNPSKSIFGASKGKILGHIVYDSRISIDLKRIVYILNLTSPISKKEVKTFMGIINFLHIYFPDFNLMVKLIHNILRKDHSVYWTEDIENYFMRIKKVICFAPVLVKLNFEKDFIVYTNATKEAIFVIRLQCDE